MKRYINDKDKMMKEKITRYERWPKKIKASGCSAWWYAEHDGIEIHIDGIPKPGRYIADHYIVKFPLAKLKDYVRRMTRSDNDIR